MPVATRSQLNDEHNALRYKSCTEIKPPRIRSSHHDLKKKMETLTALYEKQRKQVALSRKSVTVGVDLPFSAVKDDTPSNPLAPACNPKLASRNYSLPTMPKKPTNEAKENIPMESNRLVGCSTGVTKKANNLDSCKINVFVKLRPTSKKEKEEGSRCCVKIVNMRDIYLTEFLTENDYLRLKRVRGRHFTFDASFPDSTSQEEVYSRTTSELVEAVLQGKNGSVFCYGATGAGKTYTMLGTLENPGLMVLAIKDLFSKIRQRSYDGNHTVHLSYLEVYNDSVRDLLSPGRSLVLREDKQGIVAAGLTQYRAYSTDEVMALLQRGNLNRTTEPTRANETSSRSHAILQIVAEYKFNDSASTHAVNRIGKLSLIDLAGSERALATDQRTLRSFEGANINKSLLALSSCINALVEGKKHIPYRNSKLTQLLKDSLGGPCNTVMIANISPSNLSFAETQNTLHWADRAKEIRTKMNEVNEEILLGCESEGDKRKLAEELRRENEELKERVKILEENVKRMKKKHALELKQRDEIIYALSKNQEESNRFKSPAQGTKKRSFCDIASDGSPSVLSNARKLRSSVAVRKLVPPSMLLQPGFASRKNEPS